MRSLRILALAAAAAVIVVASPAQAAPVVLTANMTADEEVPQKGPAGVTGSATLDVNKDNNQVCYTFVTPSLKDPVTGGHIHKGALGVAGDVLIDLKVTAGNLKGCVTDQAANIQAVLADPQAHYVNLHTQANPAGAVRGQLMAAITNPQAAVPESESAAPNLARTGPTSASLLVAIGFGLLSAGTAVRLGSRRR
jgi:LPXTG-motif cell wall-anchored protein